MNSVGQSVSNCINSITEKYDISVLEEIGNPIDVIYKSISYILGISVLDLKLNKNNMCLNCDETEKLEEYVKKMVIEHVPIQYITGKVNIYNEEYIVNSSVLIPRPDTEVLIETAIKYIEENKLKNMLDICTGSGAVGISIAKNSNLNSADISDISEVALEVAKKNIKLNGMDNKCKIYVSDLFMNIPYLILSKYDIIVGNPPYIAKKAIENLSRFVQKEPILALDGGDTGLDIYIRIFDEARDFLKDGALIILEIGCDQAESITNILNNIKEYEILEIVKDINSKDRVIVCRFHQR